MEKKGGSRVNAGRKQKEETIVLSYRVPSEHAYQINKLIKKIITDAKNSSGQKQEITG